MASIRFLIIALILVVLAAACGGGGDPAVVYGPVNSFVALAPRVLRAGETETVSLTLFKDDRLANSTVTVSLSQGDSVVARQTARIEGKGTVDIVVPQDATGEYEVTLQGQGFTDQASVQVQDGTLLFIETDKPIYKPGQTVMIRVVSLNSDLLPLTTTATVEIADGKGNKIMKQDVTTDEFGMATLDLPVSYEPNLGVWKVSTKAGDTSTEIDVRIEKYVLPKYEVIVEFEKPWFLINEPIAGTVDATYSFGKPVNGDMTIKATRYVGIWEEFATFEAAVVDGKANFEVAAAGYVAGVAEAGGNGNVQLDITVTERNTGYEETTTELVTVSQSSVNVILVPETQVFKPGLPFNVLVFTETPDGQPVDSSVDFQVYLQDENYNQISTETRRTETLRGVGKLTITPPSPSTQLYMDARIGDQAWASLSVGAAYSPSGNFIHLSQLDPTALRPGVTAHFHVDATAEAQTFYYEVVARDRVVFTSTSESPDISFKVTPQMAGPNKLIVYQILPNSEVAADFIPFEVEAAYPHTVTADFSTDEAAPGDDLTVDIQAEGRSKVGLVAVDRSVFILAENRLNLAQVFAEIERLYQQPQAELHEAEFMPVVIPGAVETFEDAGMIVMTDKRVPKGKEIAQSWWGGEERAADGDDNALRALPMAAGVGGMGVAESPSSGDAYYQQELAEVQQVRQFFPETWLWQDVITGDDGAASIGVTTPDTITTWDLRAVAISADKGLGVAEADLTVFQPFFLSADLPYSAIRGERFPLKVALYNYTDTEQEFFVEIEEQPWFDLLDEAAKSVTVAPNDIGGAEFLIQPTGIGTQTVKVTARSTDSADAVIKSMIVEPEGVQREDLANGVLNGGASVTLDLPLPSGVVPDSARSYVAITGSLLSQTIQGLDQLLAMPYGCGEQNMLLFAPDTYILKYLQGTSQLTPEVRAKAETLLVTGYQRELTYQRQDGSFSAFGDSDPEGSLFLTSFVLKTFAQAKGLVYIDETILADASNWLLSHQDADGSFQDVGFVHHSELLGGVTGKDALTAYAAIAMIEAGQTASADKAIGYLEGRLASIDEPYALALVAYALGLGDSGSTDAAMAALMDLSEEDEDGLHWHGDSGPIPLEQPVDFAPFPGQVSGSSDIEATAYATLALTEHGDAFNAGRAAKWLTAHKNSLGGFGSTQDTVVALQALTQFAANAGNDTDMTVTIRAGDFTETVEITPQNFDVLQLVEVPAGAAITIEADGTGQAVYQGVTRYNLPQAQDADSSVFDITVEHDTGNVAVNDTVGIDVSVTFNPPEPMQAGMIVLDIAVPTGFAPVTETLDELIATDPQVKRYDVAGRKVILYIEDMAPGETVGLSFDVVAQYPVKAKGAASQAYSYYKPEWRGETIGDEIEVE